MNEMNQLIQLLANYLEKATHPASNMELFIKYCIPIIQLLVLIGGSGAGLYKYYSSKNKEINEKMLNEVYAPLYQYFVKQELYCYIAKFQRNSKECPIIEITSKKTTQNISFVNNGEKYKIDTSYETVLELNREEFLKVLKTVNVGLASKELLTLLNMYKVVIHFEDFSDKLSEHYLNATIMKVDIENALREEIVKGYEYYHKKLKLKCITSNSFYKIEDDQIIFNYEVDEDVKRSLIEKIKNSPNNF